MAFVTSKMWEQRIGRLDDVAEFNGAPVAVARMWGRQFVKRFVGEWLAGDMKALPNGREFRLSTASVLRWERHPNPASLPLALDGGDALKETIVIERRPSRTELTFEIDLPPGSMLLYQPPLTPEEIAAGCVRPPEIVGSYAVYGPLGEKIGHLLRPHATDASGRFEWLDMDAMELPNRPGTWRVRILPRSLAWLNEAAWPVTIDPTFGYTTVPGSDAWLSGAYWSQHGPYSPAGDGTTDSISIYANNRANDGKITLGLYDQSAGAPSARVVDTGEITLGAAYAWCTANTDSAASVTGAANYYLSHNQNQNINVKYDAAGSLWKDASSAYVSGTLPATWTAGSPTGALRIGIYVTYTAAATGQPTIKRFGGVPFAALNRGVW